MGRRKVMKVRGEEEKKRGRKQEVERGAKGRGRY